MLRFIELLRSLMLLVTSHRPLRLAALLGVGLLLVGLHGPVNETQAAAAAPEADKKEDADDAARQAMMRQESIKNLKQIMLGMLFHESKEKTFPPAFSGKADKPLLSWRVTLLPYLDDPAAKPLFEQFHLDEPWDSDHNKTLIDQMPSVYRSPASKLNDGRTVYLTPRGAATAFPGPKGIGIRKILDGTSKTIGLVEVDDEHAVPWTKPEDWKFDPEHPRVGLGGQFTGGFLVALLDSSVYFLVDGLDDKTLKSMFTMAARDDYVILRDESQRQ